MLARRVYPGYELTQRIHIVLVSKQIFSCFISSGDSKFLHQIDITKTRLMLMSCVQQPATRPRVSNTVLCWVIVSRLWRPLLCLGYHQYKYFMVRDVHENRIKFVHGEYELKCLNTSSSTKNIQEVISYKYNSYIKLLFEYSFRTVTLSWKSFFK